MHRAIDRLIAKVVESSSMSLESRFLIEERAACDMFELSTRRCRDVDISTACRKEDVPEAPVGRVVLECASLLAPSFAAACCRGEFLQSSYLRRVSDTMFKTVATAGRDS